MTGVEYNHEGQTTTAYIDGDRIGTFTNLDQARKAVQRFLQEATRIAQVNIDFGIVHPD